MGINPQPIPGVRFQIADTPSLVHKARVLEFKVFSRYDYPGTGPYITEYDPYPCLFYVAVTEAEEVVGVVRVIVQSPAGFYTTNKMVLFENWKERVEQIVQHEKALSLPMSAIEREYTAVGSFSCILNLYRLIYQDSRRRKDRWWLAPIDVKVFPHYSSTFHFDFVQIGPEQDCLGAPTVPAILEVVPAFRHLQEEDPELAAFFRR